MGKKSVSGAIKKGKTGKSRPKVA